MATDCFVNGASFADGRTSCHTTQELDLRDPKIIETPSDEGVEIISDDGEHETSSAGSLACKMCASRETKYTCPRCYAKSCSLPCVKEHKATSGCTGERDKLGFVEKSEYSETHLLNDYRFLEDAERKLFRGKSDPLNKYRIHQQSHPYKLSKKSQLLSTAAKTRHVLIRFIPPAFSRSKSNSSFFTISTNTIDWHIEWIFVTSNTVVKDKKVPETTPLVDAARKWTDVVEYPYLKKALEDYKTDAMGKCQFLLKLEGMPANIPRYYQLKPNLTLKENLKGLCLVEYPTILVMPEEYSFANQYDILEKGDMLDMDREFARHMIAYHPQLNPASQAERDLLNPESSIYNKKPGGWEASQTPDIEVID